MNITKNLYISLKLYPLKIVTIATVTIFNLQLFKYYLIMELLLYFFDDEQFIFGGYILSEIRKAINGFGRVEHKVCDYNE